MAACSSQPDDGDACHTTSTNDGSADDADPLVHATHCLNYLRQNILCAADLTLESTYVRTFADGSQHLGVSGDGAVHDCKNWVEVREILEENYSTRKSQRNVT